MPELMKEISFAKLDQGMNMPHLLDIQTRAFESLLQLDAASHDLDDLDLLGAGCLEVDGKLRLLLGGRSSGGTCTTSGRRGADGRG